MSAQVTRWDRPTSPSESEIILVFRSEGLSPSSWSNGAHDRYAQHSHSYHKVLYCLRGSIKFRMEPSGPDIELQPGDRLDISPDAYHSAVVGSTGVTCFEAPDRSRPGAVT